MTQYFILESNGDKWLLLGGKEATSGKAAISAFLKDNDQQGGEFVAVPARSWQPVKVAVETALKFS